MAPTHLIADMRAYLPEREYLQCMEQGEAANTQRLYAILAERGRLGEVGWGWIRVNDRKIQCWMIQTEVNDDPISAASKWANVRMLFSEFKGCNFDVETKEITLAQHHMRGFSQWIYIMNKRPYTIMDIDADTPWNVEWKESLPLNLHSYARVGLPIQNIKNLVRPGQRASSYHISRPISEMVGEIPIISLDVNNRDKLRFAYRATRLLRKEYGTVLLRPILAMGGEWTGKGGFDKFEHYVQNNPALAKSHGRGGNKPWENLLGQRVKRLSALEGQLPGWVVNPPTSAQSPAQSPFLFTLSAETLQSSSPATLTSVWKEKTPAWDTGLPDLEDIKKNFPLLSLQYALTLKGLPNDISTGDGPQAPYLAGVGPNKQQESVLEALNHPRKHTFSFLPQTLVLAGALHKYIEEIEENKGQSEDERFNRALTEAIDNASGTLDSWTYLGAKGSLFCFHQEDAVAPSINQLVLGAPKVWIFIQAAGMEMLRRLFQGVIHPCYMVHRELFLHPNFLASQNIPFSIAVQQQGDIILADARSGHEGWNTGMNVAEAVNYVDVPCMDFTHSEVYNTEGMVAWPCVCGIFPVPTDPDMGETDTEHGGPFLSTVVNQYRPEWDTMATKACSALHAWMETLLRHIKPGVKKEETDVTIDVVLRLRDFVYAQMEGHPVVTS